MRPVLDIINDTIHELKEREPKDPIADALNKSLYDIINKFVLDQDPHIWASYPTSLPPKFSHRPYSPKEYREFNDLVYQWLPQEPIELEKFLARCLHNSEKDIISFIGLDIKSSLLMLKEEGKIDIIHDGVIRKRSLV